MTKTASLTEQVRSGSAFVEVGRSGRELSLPSSCAAREQIEMQGEFMDKLADLIIKTYGQSNNVTKDDVFFIG